MPRVALLALAVGLVLADSSIVTLGLPDVLAAFDTTPPRVAWVLTGFNLVLAVAALPAAALARSLGPAALVRGGLVLFALTSLACAVAPSLGVLVAARCLQGLGGAAVAVGALPLLVDAAGSRARGTTVWAVAGAIGAAVGPAAGGLLTEAFSWEAIFAVQVPIALACLPAATKGTVPLEARAAQEGTVPLEARAAQEGTVPLEAGGAVGDRPAVPALLALAALGAGLTAALFLIVLLLIAGWRESPLTAALTVTVMPVAALAAGRVGRGLDERARGAAGAVLVAGGLAALALLPEAGIGWTIAPQVLIGLGLGLSLDALTEAAVRDRTPLALHGGWTIAARHAGIVVALAVLTPLFTADLEREEERAEERGLALVLDAPIAPATKLSLGLALAERIDDDAGRVPEVGPAFAAAPPSDPADAPAYARLEAQLDEELDRAATAAFQRSFLIGAVLAALAAVPLLLRVRA